jgi:adenine deaminase
MDITLAPLRRRIRAAKKEIQADLVLKNGRIVNVFTGQILQKDVAVLDGVIVGVGQNYQGKVETDLNGGILIPGMIDAHFHIESSMMTPPNLAAALVVHGTTTVVADPHEIANVSGMDGVRFMINQSASIPFDFFFMAPSCVPATHLETAGAELSALDLLGLKENPRVLGLAEMMNFPGLLMGDEHVLEKIMLFSHKILDGHCPGLRGDGLQAYLAAGIRSDHETYDPVEAMEKLENGMMIMLRDGSSARSLENLVPLIHTANSRNFCIVSDDLHAEDILRCGHLDASLKKSFKLGLDPLVAVQMVTRNPSEYFGLRDRGAIAPGYRADMVVLDQLETFNVVSVYKDGRQVVDSNGVLPVFGPEIMPIPQTISMNMPPMHPDALHIPHLGRRARVMRVVPGQIVTHQTYEEIPSKNGWVHSDIASDILKICVVERHRGSGRVGLGLIRGFGLKKGAIASSIAHDSHNVIALGVTDPEVALAVETIRQMGGGLVAVSGDHVLTKVPLEIAGLMSRLPIEALVPQLDLLDKAVSELGCILDNPFMVLSFLALPVIPDLKLTDLGLVDVRRFEIVPLFPED